MAKDAELDRLKAAQDRAFQRKREHYHLVIDEHGHELFSEWRVNR